VAELTIRISDRTLKICSVFLAAILLVWLFLLLWSTGVFRTKYDVHMFLPGSGNIQVGAAVRLNGMQIGNVRSIVPATDSKHPSETLDVTLRLEKRFQNLVRDDSTASVLSVGLLGEKYVAIQPGVRDAPLEAGSSIQVVPIRELTLTDIVGAIGKLTNCPCSEKDSSGKHQP
jgi:phospholipid/cholesterol/gamma-HCH transport system substrate-binding protein